MGFKVVNIQQAPAITIDSLTVQMIQDLIQCYAADVPAENFEARFNLPIGLSLDYPIISKEVVQQFYAQLDMLKDTIINIVIGKFHTGSVEITEDGYRLDKSVPTNEEINAWAWGTTPNTLEELKYWVLFVVERDFFQSNTWIYSFSSGHFEAIAPFINSVIDLMIAYNDHGNYDEFVQAIKNAFPFEKPE